MVPEKLYKELELKYKALKIKFHEVKKENEQLKTEQEALVFANQRAQPSTSSTPQLSTSSYGVDNIDLGEEIVVSYEQWSEIRTVPKGTKGDSRFCKNMCSAIWGDKLAEKSVKQNKKNAELNPLTPTKVLLIKKHLRKRILEEQPNIEEADMAERLKRVNHYLTEKVGSEKKRLKKAK